MSFLVDLTLVVTNIMNKVFILLTSLHCLIANLLIYFIANAQRASEANFPPSQVMKMLKSQQK